MKHLDLFSGIGGFALAARNVGWETVGFCEIDPYCQKVLAKHWPGVPIYEDVRDVTAERLRADGIRPTLITGGFPCQDISYAGKGAGIDGERSGLWAELARIIGDIRPRWAVLENVAALLSRGLDRVAGDLAEIGYDCEWHCIPASAVGAPHRRDRIWIVAYPSDYGSQDQRTAKIKPGKKFPPTWGDGWDVAHANQPRLERGIFREISRAQIQVAASRRSKSMGDTASLGQSGSREHVEWCGKAEDRERKAGNAISIGIGDQWSLEPDVGRVANGIPYRVDRLRGLGNAIVPQVAEVIFRAINEVSENGQLNNDSD